MACLNEMTSETEVTIADSIQVIQVNPVYVTAITNPPPMPTTLQTISANDCTSDLSQRPSRVTRSWVVRRRHSELPYRMPAPHASHHHRRSSDGWSCPSPAEYVNGITKRLTDRSYPFCRQDRPPKAATIEPAGAGSCTLTTDVEGAECRLQVPVDVFSRSQSLSDLRVAGLEICKDTSPTIGNTDSGAVTCKASSSSNCAGSDDQALDAVVKDFKEFHVHE